MSRLAFSLNFRIFQLLCLLTLTLFPFFGAARGICADKPADRVSIGKLRIGFDGYYKIGRWCPLFVTVTSQQDAEVRLVVEVSDPDGDLTVLAGGEVALKAGEPQRLESSFKPGRLEGNLKLRIESDEFPDEEFKVSPDSRGPLRPALRLEHRLSAVVGRPAGFQESDEERTSFATLDAIEELPAHARSYESLDALVIATAADGDGGESVLTLMRPQQFEAIRTWVHGGGHLVVSLADAWEAYQSSPLADWIAVPVTGAGSERRLSGFESLTGRNQPLRFAGAVRIAQIGKLAVRPVVRGATGPLMMQTPYGTGRVTFLAVDLNRDPFRDWGAADALARRIVLRPGESPLQQQKPVQSSFLGVNDLSTQFHAAQQDFQRQGVGRLSIWAVLLGLLVYLLVIGPVDYFVVHRWLKRPQLTWVTLPLLVTATCLLAVWIGRTINGDTQLVRQIDLIDVDEATRSRRVNTWLTLYSSKTGRYRVEVSPLKGAAAATISWFGSPETGIGGLYRSGGLQLSQRIYKYGDDAASLEDVPVPIWSTKSLRATWLQEDIKLVQSSLESAHTGQLFGSIAHRFPVALEDCVLAVENRVYLLPKLEPLRAWHLRAGSRSRQLRPYLTDERTAMIKERGQLEEQLVTQTAKYNPRETDMMSIMRMLTFHNAAGGGAYTGLGHDGLAELDLSSHLRLGRAVLLARLSVPVSSVLIDGQPAENVEQQSFVRLVLPVKLALDSVPGMLRELD